MTWVGHSTFLMQLGELNVLTDPIWSQRASPVPFAGPRRQVPPGVPFDRLPPIDVVLLSHNHYDHLDLPTVRRLASAYPAAEWYVPLGVRRILERNGVSPHAEMDWWESSRSDRAVVTCTPAQHFSRRGLTDRDRSLWCGWAVRSESGALFVAGDTGYHPVFGEIARRCGPFDGVFLPIGAYDPRRITRPVHMDPAEAVRAYDDLCDDSAPNPLMIPMHWGTFQLTDEPLDEPPERLHALWDEHGRSPSDLWLLAPGETRSSDLRSRRLVSASDVGRSEA